MEESHCSMFGQEREDLKSKVARGTLKSTRCGWDGWYSDPSYLSGRQSSSGVVLSFPQKSDIGTCSLSV